MQNSFFFSSRRKGGHSKLQVNKRQGRPSSGGDGPIDVVTSEITVRFHDTTTTTTSTTQRRHHTEHPAAVQLLAVEKGTRKTRNFETGRGVYILAREVRLPNSAGSTPVRFCPVSSLHTQFCFCQGKKKGIRAADAGEAMRGSGMPQAVGVAYMPTTWQTLAVVLQSQVRLLMMYLVLLHGAQSRQGSSRKSHNVGAIFSFPAICFSASTGHPSVAVIKLAFYYHLIHLLLLHLKLLPISKIMLI